jgi:hypothetical protein
MYVIKMKTLIYYFAVFAIVLASIGVIRLYSPQPEVMVTTAFEKTQAVDYYNSAEHSSIFES